ncbi:MAG: hypothetical protein HGA85_08295 [Nanoarchaeota archaeon]|nr:hypothetical protein [Nanoarchaeota archaeon]
MNKLLIIWVISLILCPVFLLPVEVSAQIVVGPPGDLFGCGPGAAETIRAIEENCDVGGMGSHDDGDDQGLCTFVNIYKALCNDKTGPTGLIIRILKHYNQWKRFLALIGKAEKTAQEL